MKEKRSLFQMVFGKKESSTIETKSQLQMLNSIVPSFTTYGKDVYDSKIARECIDRIATHCAKLIPRHIKKNAGNAVNGDINFLLQNQPNPLMTTFDFIYKVISNLYTDSNAFVFVQKDKDGFITGFYPVQALNYTLLEDNKGTIFLEFKFINGKVYTLPYLDLIHLRLFYNKHDILGTNNKVLNTDLETAHTASEGIKNAIKLSSNLRGILKFTNAMIKPSDIKESKDRFVNDFLSLENESGIAGLDAKADFQEVQMKPITLDAQQMALVNSNIYDYFGISEAIIHNKFTSEEWNAFYEGVIEARAIQLSDAFTQKIFSQKAIKEGHKIVFTTNRLQYANLTDKINLVKELCTIGVLTKNEVREIFDMSELEGEEGNKIIQSLNSIDSSIANDYQSNKEDENE